MKRILLFFALFIAIPSFAQIEEEIMQSSKSAKIAQGRDYLVEKFLDRDYDKVKEIKDYLLSLEGDDYVALTPYELWHILAWTKEFDALTENLRQFDSVYFESFNNKIFPEKDMLLRKLYLKGCEDEHLIRFNIQEAQLQPEDDAAVSLVFDWLLQKSVDGQDELNEKSTRFLKDYPDSDYEWFVRHLIREQYAEDDWGMGLGFDVCSGLSTGELSNPVFGLGFCFDILYKKFDFILGGDILISKTAIDQVYSFEGNSGLVYPKGSWCDWVLPYVNVAYSVFDNKRIAISPFIGIGCVYEEYPLNKDKQNEYEDLIKTLLLCKVGSYFNIMLSSKGFEKHLLRIKYEFGMTGLNSGEVSSLHVLSIGWSGLFRGKKRVY